MSLQIVGKGKPSAQPRTIESIIKSTDHRLKDPRALSPSRQDFRTLRHYNLDDHPVFIELKEKLEAYYEDRNLPLHKQRVLVSKSHYWREVLYNSLLELLSELTFTDDSALQTQLLAKVKKWYDEKTKTFGTAIQTPRSLKPKLERRQDTQDAKLAETSPKESVSMLMSLHTSFIKSQSSTAPSSAPSSAPLRSGKLPSVQAYKPEQRHFNDFKQLMLTEEDLQRTNTRFNQFRENEAREINAIAVRNGEQ